MFAGAGMLMKKQSGQIILLLVPIVPVLLLALAVVVDIGILSYRRIRLQTATDLAAYAGASVLAEEMTEMSRQLSELDHEWEDASDDEKDMMFHEKIAENEVYSHEHFSQKFRNAADAINQTAYHKAVSTASSIMKRNINWASPADVDCEPYYPPLGPGGDLMPFSILQQQGKTYDYPTGGEGPYDPSGTDGRSATVVVPIEILAPYPQVNVAFVCRGKAPLNYPSLSGAIGRLMGIPPENSQREIFTYAAAQPYGGTLRTEDEGGSLMPIEDDRRNYRPAMVPLAGITGDNYLPLSRVAPAGGGDNPDYFPTGEAPEFLAEGLTPHF